MEEPEQIVKKDLSNSVYNPAIDLSGYQYPELSLVCEAFKRTLAAAMAKRQSCSFPVLLGDYSNLIVEDLFNRPNLLITEHRKRQNPVHLQSDCLLAIPQASLPAETHFLRQ